MTRKPAALALLTAAAALTLVGCSSDADTVSHNLSKDAEQFKVERRVVLFNGITDKYLLTIEGRCSVEPIDGRLEVICKVGEDSYKKHFLGLSDNVSWFAEQLEGADVDEFHYKVIFKPEAIVPDVDLRTSNQG
jgi:hypothetical protein